MKNINKVLSFAVAMSLLISVMSLLQSNALKKSVSLNVESGSFEQLMKDNEDELAKYVNHGIKAYVETQKKERVSRKFDAYELAGLKTRTGDRIYGDEDARFTLLEFSDLECPYCKRFHQAPKGVVDAANGLVNWQWKHLPLPSHNPIATLEAQASECVAELEGNRAFWVFLHETFEKTKGNGRGAGDLLEVAGSVGVDKDAFSECVKKGSHRERLAADQALAQRMGVNSTPVTFVIDNHTGQQVLLRGMQRPEVIASTIQRLLKQQDVDGSKG